MRLRDFSHWIQMWIFLAERTGFYFHWLHIVRIVSTRGVVACHILLLSYPDPRWPLSMAGAGVWTRFPWRQSIPVEGATALGFGWMVGSCSFTLVRRIYLAERSLRGLREVVDWNTDNPPFSNVSPSRCRRGQSEVDPNMQPKRLTLQHASA